MRGPVLMFALNIKIGYRIAVSIAYFLMVSYCCFKNNKFIRAARRLRRHKVLIIKVLNATCGARQESGQGTEGNT